MCSFPKHVFAAISLLLGVCIASAVSHAGDVTLRSKSGSVTVSGSLIKYDGKTFEVETPDTGRLTLEASRFDCVAGECPAPLDAAAAKAEARVQANVIAVQGTNAIGARILPALIQAYAGEIGAQMMAPSTATDNVQEIVLTEAGGKVAAAIDISSESEAEAFARLGRGEVDIVMSVRPISDGEAAELEKLGLANMRSPEHEHVLGLDAAVVIVSRASPVVMLPTDAVAAIFSGQIDDWSKLGLGNGKIAVHVAKGEQGAFETLRLGVLAARGLQLAPGAVQHDSDDAVAAAVLESENAIGVVGLTSLGSARAVGLQLPCGLRYEPTTFALKAEEYPLLRRLYLYTARPLSQAHAKGLLEFALSEKAQPILSGIGGTDQTIDPLSSAGHGDRFASGLLTPGLEYSPQSVQSFLADTLYSQKLSAVFRFASGSFALDSRAARDLDRVVAYLSQEGMKGKSVLVLGFSDAVGFALINEELSKRRSDVVRDLLLQRANGAIDPQRLLSRGYGELMPVACNDSEDGLARNRRVEIWVK